LLFAAPFSAQAQTKPVPPPEPIDPFAAGVAIDYREHMRTFVHSISSYARSIDPGFVVIAKDGLGLIGKPDIEDETRIFPARAYIRAIDGVLETGLLDETITTPEGKADPAREEVVKRRLENLSMAKTFGLNVFDLEFASDPKTINAPYAAASAKGYVPYVAEAPALSTITDHPRSAPAANPKHVATAAEAQNFLFIANSSGFGTSNDFAGALRTTNYDMVVIDVFHASAPLTRQDVTWLKYKNLGAPRLVLAEIDISSAATFRYYWQTGWGKGSPPSL